MSNSQKFIQRKGKSLQKLIQELVAKNDTPAWDDTKIIWDEFVKYHDLVIQETEDSSYIPLPSYDQTAKNYSSGQMIQIMKTTIQGITDALPESNESNSETNQTLGNDVFIVHGHDNEAKQETARLIEKLGLIATILHERPNKGRTVVEKLIDESKDAGYAVILLTPDDIGFIKGKETESEERARQNVVLELGYFLGRLGRERVCVLLKGSAHIPSDFNGVLYIPMDTAGKWKFDLAKELQEAGFKIDLNKI